MSGLEVGDRILVEGNGGKIQFCGRIEGDKTNVWIDTRHYVFVVDCVEFRRKLSGLELSGMILREGSTMGMHMGNNISRQNTQQAGLL